MSIYTVNRAVIPGIARDARRLGVSRQYLSRVLHNSSRYEGTRILEEYHALKRRDAAGRGARQ